MFDVKAFPFLNLLDKHWCVGRLVGFFHLMLTEVVQIPLLFFSGHPIILEAFIELNLQTIPLCFATAEFGPLACAGECGDYSSPLGDRQCA